MKVNVSILIEGKYEFPFCIGFDIQSSNDTFSDTATVVLPFKQTNIKVGDKISISAGYDGNFNNYFNGYIKKVSYTENCELSCDDESYIYKTSSITPKVFSSEATTLFEVLAHCMPVIKFNCADAIVGKLVINENVTLIDILETIKNTYYLETYFQDGILFCGYDLLKQPWKTILCNIRGKQGNVILGTDNLEKINSDEANIVSYGKSPQKNGAKFEIYYYYDGQQIKESTVKPTFGSINEISIPNISLDELKKYTKRRLVTLYKTGIQGDLTTFGEPFVKHGDNIKIFDDQFPERNGTYRITGVNYGLSVENGLSQKISIGAKVA